MEVAGLVSILAYSVVVSNSNAYTTCKVHTSLLAT